jgi:enoyl-CoA hydratase
MAADHTPPPSTDDDDILLLERQGPIALLTLNRPRARNALSLALQERLKVTFPMLDADRDVSVIIVTGADPAFCGGVDTKEIAARRPGDPTIASRPNPADVIRAVGKPVIGAVNGPCITGGLELVLGCDFIVASERAVFADTHAQIGLVAGWGLTATLAHAIGVRRAKELSITGRQVDAAEAQAIGLTNHVVPHDDLLPFTVGLAQQVAAASYRSVRGMIELYDNGIGLTLDAAIRAEHLLSQDFRTKQLRLDRKPVDAGD